MQNFKRNLRENLVALVGASLTSQVIKVTPILPKILTSCPYNCWPLLMRVSVFTRAKPGSSLVSNNLAQIVTKEWALTKSKDLLSSFFTVSLVVSVLASNFKSGMLLRVSVWDKFKRYYHLKSFFWGRFWRRLQRSFHCLCRSFVLWSLEVGTRHSERCTSK